MDISVIVPVFNGGRKIRRCVRALKRQRTEKSYEIIVVDDGSTDGSLQWIKGNGVRVLEQANQGPAAARNSGVEKAQGKVVLFTDADCEPLDDWIEKMVKPFDNGHGPISGVKGTYLTRQRKIVSRFVQLEYESKYARMKRDRYIDFIDTYSAGFLKKDFLSVGKYDSRFPTACVEDQEFSFRMWEQGCRMMFNPEARVYHTHSETLWNYIKKKFRIGFWKALVLKRHPKKIFRDSHTPQSLKFEMMFASLFLFCLLVWPFDNGFLFYALFPLAAFMATITPFVLRLVRKDLTVALFSPFLLFVRAVSLSVGLIAGTLKFLINVSPKESEVCEVEFEQDGEAIERVSCQ